MISILVIAATTAITMIITAMIITIKIIIETTIATIIDTKTIATLCTFILMHDPIV